jgi:E3 ubiquitin-protein ligase SHPRH
MSSPDRQPKRNQLKAYYNSITDSDVKPTGVTLIIAPAVIVGQWESEIARHAPGLSVLRYEVRLSRCSFFCFN